MGVCGNGYTIRFASVGNAKDTGVMLTTHLDIVLHLDGFLNRTFSVLVIFAMSVINSTAALKLWNDLLTKSVPICVHYNLFFKKGM